jgi:hypothetical protein
MDATSIALTASGIVLNIADRRQMGDRLAVMLEVVE